MNYIKMGLRLSISLYVLLHFISYFYEHKMLLSSMAITGLLIFLFSICLKKMSQFKIPLTLVGTGLIILMSSNSSIINGFYEGMLLMRNIIGLLVIIPFIGWVLNTEPYIESVMSFAYKMINTSRKFYFAISSFTQVIAFFLLFGSIPMMYDFVNKMVGNQHGEPLENFKGTALLRSFALSTIWVVTIPSFIFAVETLKSSLWLSILQGMLISISGILIAVLFSYFEEKKYGVNLTEIISMEMKQVMAKSSVVNGNGNVKGFFLLFLTLFGSIFLVHAIWPIELMLQVPFVIIIWTIFYFLWKKRVGRLATEAKQYFTNKIEHQSYQLSMMLGAGMMIYSINQTGFGGYVVSSVNFMQEHFPSINLLYFLPFIVILLGFVGLGPLTVMVLVAGILKNIALPYPPELIVLSITSGSVISIMLSPVIMPVIVLSAANGLSGLKNGVRFNWKFAIVFYLFVQVYIQVMLLFWS